MRTTHAALKVLAAAVLLLVSSRALGDDPRRWGAPDVALEGAFALAVAADVLQTRGALEDGCREMNPVLGSRPSSARLVALAGAGVASHALISALLPRAYRGWWQAATLTLEVGVVAHNVAIGARVSF